MIGALTGAVSGVAAVIGLLAVNGKVDRLTGRVDGLESTMQTVVTALVGRAGADRWSAAICRRCGPKGLAEAAGSGHNTRSTRPRPGGVRPLVR